MTIKANSSLTIHADSFVLIINLQILEWITCFLFASHLEGTHVLHFGKDFILIKVQTTTSPTSWAVALRNGVLE